MKFELDIGKGPVKVEWQLNTWAQIYFEDATGDAYNEFFEAAKRGEFRIKHWTAIIWAGCKAGAKLNGTPFHFDNSYENFVDWMIENKFNEDKIVTEGMRLMGLGKNEEAPKKKGA